MRIYNSNRRLRNCLSIAVCGFLIASTAVKAQDTSGTNVDSLTFRQAQVSDKYVRLEALMLRMAEFDAATNPRRAQVLKKAYTLSKQDHVGLQLETIANLLGQDKLSRAITNQKAVEQDLNAILKLLLTENRANRLKNEQTRVQNYIKDLERIIRGQRWLRSRTENGDDPNRLADHQQELQQRTDSLGREMDENEGASSTDPKERTSKSDSPQAEQEGESEKPAPTEEAPESGKTDRPESDAPSPASPNGQQPSPSEEGASEGESPSSQPSYPGRQRVEQARQKMEDAQQRLRQSQQQGAEEAQQEAIRELQRAKAELEKILRQLREEEIERTLAVLEARFRKMLDEQTLIYEKTQSLGKIAQQRRSRQWEIDAGKLGFQERRIVRDAESALALLREEGSSVAFPESVEQMRDDMRQVADRLARGKLGNITQGIEQDIIAALEEMIEALQVAAEQQEERRDQQQSQSPPSDEDQQLVNQIAELKMLRALQFRINRRTTRYSQLLEDVEDPAGQATDQELIDALRILADREGKLQKITREIVLGKNK